MLTSFSDHQRTDAMKKYKIIEPYLNKQETIKEISIKNKIPIRTLYRWVQKYEHDGLVGLIRKTRNDFEKIKVSEEVCKKIEEFVLRYKKISTKTLSRKITSYCKENKLDIPSYSQIYKLRKRIPKSLIQLAHEGEKIYKEKYDLIAIRETTRPNEIWQADHTLLDINLLDEKGNINRPWLTIILDDYSRAVAGYYLSFSAPSAINTALTLHQAIWTKKDSSWPICGIPENFYTDHGSDFTSNFMEQVAVDLRINLIFSSRGPERLVGICIDKGYKFPLNQCFKAYLFFIFNSLKCLGIDNKSNLYSPRKVICSQLIGDTCFIYLVTSGSILTR